MAILDLKPRLREIGRIRIGQRVPTGTEGKTRPEKLDRFRITSYSKPLLEAVAQQYGGEVREWTPDGGVAQFEVITEAKRIPILIPPEPISQWYEVWAAGGCQRRCDGVREWLSDVPCICAANGQKDADRDCKPTTRINVMVRDVPGIGLFRLESHGWYAANEIPQLASLLEQAGATGNYLPAFLGLEERRILRDGKTRRFMVPTLDLDVAPAALLADGAAALGIEAPKQKELDAAPPADELVRAQEEVRKLVRLLGWSVVEWRRAYAQEIGPRDPKDATVEELQRFTAYLDRQLAAISAADEEPVDAEIVQ